LKDAAGPEPLPDGSLVIWRVDEERRSRLYHFWPDSGRIEPLGAWIAPNYPVAMDRVFPDGKEAVFYGWDKSAAAGASPGLYVIDLTSGQTRRLAPQLPIHMTTEGFPMAPTADNRSVIIDLPSGDLHQIVAIPRSGSGPIRVLMTLTTPPWIMDVGPDGSIFLDQVDRPFQVLRFPTSGGTPEALATSPAFSAGISSPAEFPDGRFLIPALDSGRPRLLIGKPGGNFFPLSDTREENRLPATLLPGNQVAFVAGTGSEQTIVIASAADGRISRRLQGCKGIYVTRLAASRDGRTLYYSADGTIWSIPAADGKPHKIAPGDGVAVDPNGKDLIISSLEKSGESLFRVPLSGGPPQQIHIQGNVTLDPLALGEHSLSKRGKLVIVVTSPDSWFFSAAVLDVATGGVKRIPLNFTGDILQSRWTSDGHILALAEPMQAHIWRFRPAH
jgi:eukaryotic-like serine/threonine-protein kinase